MIHKGAQSREIQSTTLSKQNNYLMPAGCACSPTANLVDLPATQISTRLQVMRIIPRNNEEVNEDWISDKARFQYDGLKRQRLNIPLVKDEQGAFTSALWPEALTKVCLRRLEAAGVKFAVCALALSRVVGGPRRCPMGRGAGEGVWMCVCGNQDMRWPSVHSVLIKTEWGS